MWCGATADTQIAHAKRERVGGELAQLPAGAGKGIECGGEGLRPAPLGIAQGRLPASSVPGFPGRDGQGLPVERFEDVLLAYDPRLLPVAVVGEGLDHVGASMNDETPINFAYFYDYLSATQKNVTGVYPTAQGQLFLWNAAKS
jgi:hypothetical protein